MVQPTNLKSEHREELTINGADEANSTEKCWRPSASGGIANKRYQLLYSVQIIKHLFLLAAKKKIMKCGAVCGAEDEDGAAEEVKKDKTVKDNAVKDKAAGFKKGFLKRSLTS